MDGFVMEDKSCVQKSRATYRVRAAHAQQEPQAWAMRLQSGLHAWLPPRQ